MHYVVLRITPHALTEEIREKMKAHGSEFRDPDIMSQTELETWIMEQFDGCDYGDVAIDREMTESVQAVRLGTLRT